MYTIIILNRNRITNSILPFMIFLIVLRTRPKKKIHTYIIFHFRLVPDNFCTVVRRPQHNIILRCIREMEPSNWISTIGLQRGRRYFSLYFWERNVIILSLLVIKPVRVTAKTPKTKSVEREDCTMKFAHVNTHNVTSILCVTNNNCFYKI